MSPCSVTVVRALRALSRLVRQGPILCFISVVAAVVALLMFQNVAKPFALKLKATVADSGSVKKLCRQSRRDLSAILLRLMAKSQKAQERLHCELIMLSLCDVQLLIAFP